MKKYSVEELREIFKEHAIQANKRMNDLIEEFKTKYPGEKLPQHMLDDFSISTALECICEEIVQLKNSLK